MLKFHSHLFYPLCKSCTWQVCFYPISLWFLPTTVSHWQGGPGFENNAPYKSGYIGKVETFCSPNYIYIYWYNNRQIHDQGYQVRWSYDHKLVFILLLMPSVLCTQTLWLDQRGTGLSTPLSPDTLPSSITTDEQIAKYLKHFRADSIGML